VSDYWKKAVALEAAEKIPEAIEVLRTEMGPLAPNWEAQVSHLFEQRAERLWRAGRKSEAREAAKQAIDWFWRYAGGATSGSEGLMYSGQAKKVEQRMAKYLEVQ
jgi:hypothetical protein